MTIYVCMFVFLAGMSFIERFCKKNRLLMRMIAILTMIIWIALSALRGGVRGDYISYKLNYSYVRTDDIHYGANFFFEPLYSLLQFLCKCCTDNFQFMVLILGLIVVMLQWNYAKDFAISDQEKQLGDYFFTICFVIWALYLGNIFVVRSTIATLICLYSTKFIECKDFKKFIITVFIAIGFHYSAAVFLPAYFIYRIHAKIRTKLLIIVAGAVALGTKISDVVRVIGNITGGTLGRKLNGYLSSDDFMNGTGMENGSGLILLLKALLNIGILLILAIYLWRYNKENLKYEGYMNLYFVGCVLYVATLTVGYAFARLSIYYNIFQVPMIMYLYNTNIQSNSSYREKRLIKNNRYIYWIVMTIYLFLRFYINNSSQPPYVTFWQ